MGKGKGVKKTSVLQKILLCMVFFVVLLFLAYIGLMISGYDPSQSFAEALAIVTGVDIITKQMNYKYFFALLNLLGGVVQFYFLYIILEYVVEGKFQDIFLGVKYMNKVKTMKNHYIIAGGGRVGSHSAKLLKQYEKEVVVVDRSEERVEKLRKEGFIAVKGDVLDETFLKEINIENAQYLIACLGSDSDNLLLVLTAREINPHIKISARANSDAVVSKLSHAGASHVVVPSSLGGEELAKIAARSE